MSAHIVYKVHHMEPVHYLEQRQHSDKVQLNTQYIKKAQCSTQIHTIPIAEPEHTQISTKKQYSNQPDKCKDPVQYPDRHRLTIKTITEYNEQTSTVTKLVHGLEELPPPRLWKVKGQTSLMIVHFFIGPSEVRALPVRRCRQAAWQTKWPLSSLFFSSLLSSLYALLLSSQKGLTYGLEEKNVCTF
jgi:hypothetical protein